MSFADTEKTKNFEKRRTEFMELIPGATKVRILDKNAYMLYTHYLGGVSVACLGDECPICKNNTDIILKHKDNFREVQGYVAKSRRYFVNVLDKSLVKICPKCSKEVKQDLVACPECMTMLNGVEKKPLNKVKVLAKGVTLFEQLNAIDENVTDADGVKIGLNKFDVTIVTTGAGKTVNYTVIPDGSGVYKEEEVDESLKYDVKNCTVVLTPEEMLDLFRGVKLRDILLMRGKSDEPVAKEPEQVTELSEEELNKIQADLENLFKKDS